MRNLHEWDLKLRLRGSGSGVCSFRDVGGCVRAVYVSDSPALRSKSLGFYRVHFFEGL